jgi:hypothetical protein
MEIIVNSLRNVFYGAIVLIINIPIFWSFQGLIDFVRNAVKTIGLEI